MVKKGQAPRGLLALSRRGRWACLPCCTRSAAARSMIASWVHFALVATGALVAAFASVWLTILGARANDGRTVLIGAAFSTMTALLAIHGLATPGIIVGPNGVIALAGAASLPAGGAVLALTALPAMRRPLRMRPVLAHPGRARAPRSCCSAASASPSPPPCPACPPPAARPPRPAGFGVAFYALLALRAVRTYTLTRRTTDLLVFVGCVWLGWALVPQLVDGLRHARLLLRPRHGADRGSSLVGIPAALDLRQGGASRPLVGDLTATELVGAEEAFLGPRVRALMLDLAEKDRSTEEHTRRVATLACAVGEELKLPPTTLRHLAIGGLLHDMGKLRTPPGDPLQAQLADRRGVRGDQVPPRGRRAPARRPRRLRPRGARAGARPPRAARRRRLPARPARRPDRPRDAGADGLRRLRRARLPPRLPPGLEPGAGARAAARGERDGVRRRAASPRSSACSRATRTTRAGSPRWRTSRRRCAPALARR